MKRTYQLAFSPHLRFFIFVHFFIKCFAEYSLYSDIDEDESKGVYRDFAMPPEEDPDN